MDGLSKVVFLQEIPFKMKRHQHRWLAGDYDLEIGLFSGG